MGTVTLLHQIWRAHISPAPADDSAILTGALLECTQFRPNWIARLNEHCGVPLKTGELVPCAPCTLGADFYQADAAYARANPRPKRPARRAQR